ncbi:MAG: DUF3868 domain-containing protein [Prevotellaceae bacterium]|nr:DUF3868 domain-containing protein [Prevotellaceae bacterium]
MKHTLIITAALTLMASAAGAQNNVVDGVNVSGVKLDHDGGQFTVDMDLSLTGLDVERNRAVLVTPRLVNGEDSVDFPSVAVYGRRRYFYYVRNKVSMLTGTEEDNYRTGDKPDEKQYHEVLPYESWMNGATLWIHRDLYGCCNSLLDEQAAPLGEYWAFEPQLVYLTPSPVKETRSLEGRANIVFRVNKTDIDPSYHNNTAELTKIRATIDSVRSDNDITITSVLLKGFASPESPYAHNTELAKGRVEAVKAYVQNLYRFADGVISTDFEPENWQELREYVDKSTLAHRSEILGLIDTDMDPDAKEDVIKKAYPQDYKLLLQNCYPYLRHTDYKVSYVVRTFTDIEEIKRVYASEPYKLGLNEMFMLAQEYEPGTEEFTEIFETAVRMYPGSEEANLNVAVAEIRRGDMDNARKHLAKAGDSGEAVYTRGVVAVMEKDYANARLLLENAKARGIREADYCLGYIDKATKAN